MAQLFSKIAIPVAAILLAAPAGADIQDTPNFDVPGLVVVWSADPTGAAPVAVDFIVDTVAGPGDADLIAADAHTVVTGTLISTDLPPGPAEATRGIPFNIDDAPNGDFTTDANGDLVVDGDDAFSPFVLDADTDITVGGTQTSSSFYVASNTPFVIEAQATAPTSFLDLLLLLAIELDLSVELSGDDGLAFGSQAQFPHTAGPTGGVTAGATLFSMLGGTTVFTGNQRTAAAPGSLAEQSVRFDAAYTIGAGSLTGYDLSLGTFDFEVEVVYTVFVP